MGLSRHRCRKFPGTKSSYNMIERREEHRTISGGATGLVVATGWSHVQPNIFDSRAVVDFFACFTFKAGIRCIDSINSKKVFDTIAFKDI